MIFTSFGARGPAAPITRSCSRHWGLWLEGLTVDWTGFYKGQDRNRLTLPTYPFEHKSYWVAPPRGEVSAAGPQPRTVGKLGLDEWLSVPVWKQSFARAEDPPPARSDGPPPQWLVFADECGVGRELAGRRKSRGDEVVAVVPGEPRGWLDDSTYRCAPRPRRITPCWCESWSGGAARPSGSCMPGPSAARPVGPNRGTLRGVPATRPLQPAGTDPGLSQENVTVPVRLDVLTSDVQSVTGEEVLSAEKATVHVACKVISQEHANIRCTHVDLPAPPPAGGALTSSWIGSSGCAGTAGRGRRLRGRTAGPRISSGCGLTSPTRAASVCAGMASI